LGRLAYFPLAVPSSTLTSFRFHAKGVKIYVRVILNLKTAVERKTNVEDIGVPGERKKFVVTSGVMRHFFILAGAPRACANCCDPTAVSWLNLNVQKYDTLPLPQWMRWESCRVGFVLNFC